MFEQTGVVVAGVVQDMLAVHREDTNRRQDIQLQMMMAHREETELRVIEAREAADKEMQLMCEIQEREERHAAELLRWRELAVEKSVRCELEDRQAMVNTGCIECAHHQCIVQREMERPRPGMVTRVSFPPGIGADSSLSSRASTPSTPQPFVYTSEHDSDIGGGNAHAVGHTQPPNVTFVVTD